MKFLIIFIFIFNIAFSDTKNNEDEYFFVGKMDSTIKISHYILRQGKSYFV